MVKKMVYNWKSWLRSLQKNNYFVLKLGASFLLVGLAFSLLCNRSPDFSPVSHAPFLENTQISTKSTSSVNSRGNIKQITTKEYGNVSSESEGKKCNIFIGDWVPYQGEPLYTNSSCKWIESHQNCMTNGRPDKDYLYWRWKPRGCELNRLESKKFLELMRNKNWAFVGDSISRNHVQSFLCVLSTVEQAIEVYHDETYKFRKWVFQSHNFTVSILWSPFLAQAAIFEDINGVSTSEIQLHLDKLDKNWTDPYPTFDYTIFSGGKWFTKSAIYYDNNIVLGSHNCPNRNLTELGFNFAYRKVIRNVFDYIIGSNRNKGMIFFRTSTPDHFEGGEWFSGGVCKRELPAKEGEFEFNVLDRVLREVEVEEFEKAAVRASENGVKFRLLDVSPLSLLRPDGHPGPYRFFQPFAKGKNTNGISDCLHWCLPGPIDSWNDILMEMVVNG